jgi:hypothetical protein
MLSINRRSVKSRIKATCVSLTLLACLSAYGFADDAAKQVYSESFKKGATKITEVTFDVTLTPDHAKQDFKVLDSTGSPRYTLRFLPETSQGDTKITGWFVRLLDAHHKIYDSVLPTSPDITLDERQIWWLDGRPYAKTPLQTTRVFKVEQFYCVVKVKDLKRLTPEKPFFSELDLTVQFTNTKP